MTDRLVAASLEWKRETKRARRKRERVASQNSRAVVFWFVLDADQDMRIEADPREANQFRWFALDDPAEWAHDHFDPHMARFRDKLRTAEHYSSAARERGSR